MTKTDEAKVGRRAFIGGTGAALAGLAAPAIWAQGTDPFGPEPVETTRRNTAIFRGHDWRPFFADLKNGAILVDTESRALHFWAEDQTTMKVYPTSVPLSEDLTRRGRTKVVRKVEGPDWRPTPAMKERNPEWPDYVGPGPDNPLGTHALYLSWTYYRIHGTHDTRKIGRKSSNGCIGLYNEHIAELFAMTKVGTQVLLI
ncbi:L,D-transpeptidase ErfK/SrfK [Rhodovulum iodosum]|uniref:L,D-transpeptidase ErfK/SrfK n=1 Tax=Rhodovulum iodosum TaxID=68291 RepID=A0ABV3XSF2_9RHOB|nr:L,D-transpeptidase [Rhodovulum robiginosum]RSK30347.1 L,D-transpeptidase [Rhodovulum robiginosum]